jgi:hypothetical protein
VKWVERQNEREEAEKRPRPVGFQIFISCTIDPDHPLD